MTPKVRAELDELREKGFVASSKELTRYFYMNPEEQRPFAKFYFGVATFVGKKLRYTCYDFFGVPTMNFYYTVKGKERFIHYLESIFLARNSSQRISESFTFLMHNFNFHWSRCYDRPRPASKRPSQAGIPNIARRKNLTAEDIEKLRLALSQ